MQPSLPSLVDCQPLALLSAEIFCSLVCSVSGRQRTQLLLRASTVANGSLSLFNQIPGDFLRMGGSMVS